MTWSDEGGRPGGHPAPAEGTNTMAILALVFAFVFWPLGIVFGHIAKRQIVETGQQGDGLATAGLVIGYLYLAFTICACGGLLAMRGGPIGN
jgi:short subunit fatty acids transporter